MIILIAGDTRTGKTVLAQKLLEKYSYPYVSIDHLKMGLIRSGRCHLSPDSEDEELTQYLWPIIREIIKTNIENGQNLIIEGCYIPFGWEKDFSPRYREQIKYICLIFSKQYIETRFEDILAFENAIEKRLPGNPDKDRMIQTNERNLKLCELHNYRYILVESDYRTDIGEL